MTNRQDHKTKQQRQAAFDKSSKAFADECFGQGVKGLSRLLQYAAQSGAGSRQYTPGRHANGQITGEGHYRRRFGQLVAQGMDRSLAAEQAKKVFGRGYAA